MELWVEQPFFSNCNRNGKKQVENIQAEIGQDREEFDKMFSYSRLYNSATSNACRPILIHLILMSIIFEQYKQLKKLENSVIRNKK